MRTSIVISYQVGLESQDEVEEAGVAVLVAVAVVAVVVVAVVVVAAVVVAAVERQRPLPPSLFSFVVSFSSFLASADPLLQPSP